MNKLSIKSGFRLDKKFLKTITRLAMPIAISNLLTALLNVIDSLMVTQLSPTAMAAVLLSNQVVFIFQVVIFSIAGAGMIFVSQYFGNNEPEKMSRVTGLCLIICVGIGLMFTLVTQFFSPQILSLFGENNTAIINEGKQFLKIVGLSSIPFAISNVLTNTLRGIKQVKMPLCVVVVSVLTNVFFNYIFMFGKLGLPAYGVVGAAYGTLISRSIEVVIMITVCAIKKYDTFRIKTLFKIDKKIVKLFLKIAIPALANELLWSLANTSYLLAFGRMADSENILAAMNVVMAVDKLLFTFLIGVGSAAGILTGNKIGEGNINEAVAIGKKSGVFTIIIGVVMGSLYAVIGILMPYVNRAITDGVSVYILQMCLVFGMAMPLKALGFTLIAGVLRAGGDTTFCAIVESASMWLIAVPMAFLGALVFNFPIWLTLLIINLLELIKLGFIVARMRTPKWIHHLSGGSHKAPVLSEDLPPAVD